MYVIIKILIFQLQRRPCKCLRSKSFPTVFFDTPPKLSETFSETEVSCKPFQKLMLLEHFSSCQDTRQIVACVKGALPGAAAVLLGVGQHQQAVPAQRVPPQGVAEQAQRLPVIPLQQRGAIELDETARRLVLQHINKPHAGFCNLNWDCFETNRCVSG